MSSPESAPRPPRSAKASWEEVVFVCRKCARKNDQRPDGKSLRKWLKRELKSRGAGKRIRIIESSCLDLCPKNGVTLARGTELVQRKPLRVFRNGDDPQGLVEWLLEAVTDEDEAGRSQKPPSS